MATSGSARSPAMSSPPWPISIRRRPNALPISLPIVSPKNSCFYHETKGLGGRANLVCGANGPLHLPFFCQDGDDLRQGMQVSRVDHFAGGMRIAERPPQGNVH